MLSGMKHGEESGGRYGSMFRLLSITITTGIALSGCVSGHTPSKSGGEPSASNSSPHQPVRTPSQAPALQSRVFSGRDSTLRMDVLSLTRLGNDKLKLQFRLTNVGKNLSMIATAFGMTSFAKVTLLDGRNMKAYFPLQSTQGNVLESGYPNSAGLEPGQPITASIFYPAPPSGVNAVDIATPITPPFSGIPIRGTAQVTKGEPDPNRVQLKPAKIEDITSMTDDLNGNASIDKSGAGTDIRLNADVLFALNKAVLSDKAHSILKDVAKKIDQATVDTIKVDGYTDNSGNDAINNPLSRRRAEAVAKELKKLVTRSGVTFKANGHGSSDPVASNDTKSGRQKNRRVTVTIGK